MGVMGNVGAFATAGGNNGDGRQRNREFAKIVLYAGAFVFEKHQSFIDGYAEQFVPSRYIGVDGMCVLLARAAREHNCLFVDCRIGVRFGRRAAVGNMVAVYGVSVRSATSGGR